MNDELHTAGLVEETLGNDPVLRGQRSEGVATGENILDQLLGGASIERALVGEQLAGDGKIVGALG